MALKGAAKRIWNRNYNRTKRYGNWRQIYYNANGICEVCGEAVDELEIHEETDGISVIAWFLVCMDCHLKKIHKDSPTDWIRRKYGSKLAPDINAEIIKYGGLENWKKNFNIKDGLKNGNNEIDLHKFQG
jgi:hypothetical protein